MFGAARLWLHHGFFPLGRAAILSVKIHMHRLKTNELCGNQLIGLAADGAVTRGNLNFIKSFHALGWRTRP